MDFKKAGDRKQRGKDFNNNWRAINSNVEFSGDASGKESTCHCRGSGSIPGSERSPGGGNGNPFQ